MDSPSSAYLFLFRQATPEAYTALSPAQREQCLDEWNGWYEGLVAAGKVQHGNPLEPVGRVVSGSNGRVVDGPFAEAKEAIGGYFYLTVSDFDEATEIARRCPNLKYGMTVEVRPVAPVCPLAKLLGHETMRA